MTAIKTLLHPRNRHRSLYDFNQLIHCCPDLAPFVALNQHGNESIDYSNPSAVKSLNKALLKLFYHIDWDLPEHFLCPPIPSRADYIHHVADILATSYGGIIPRGEKISVIDIGVGANCIYPLIGHREYGWSFIGTDIHPASLSIAERIIEQNGLTKAIKVRLQTSPAHIFKGVLRDHRRPFDISICNPPFHSSLKEAQTGTKRKWKNLKVKTDTLNFGGKDNELWCPGGEIAFIQRMIEESMDIPCRWFTTLVSKEENLPAIYKALEKAKASNVHTIPMRQGQKKSRIVAWSHRI